MQQGVYNFAGIIDPKSGIYSQSHGTDADRIVLTFGLQSPNIAVGGAVTFTYNSTSVVLPSCKVDQGQFQFDQNGFVEKAILWDRRWLWWQVPKRSFHWNEILPDGYTIRPATEKSPQDMLTQLFEWCGEGVVDVKYVPNTARPETIGDVTDPAEAINKLCDVLSCRVILGYGTDVVTVVPLNYGAALPDDGSVSRVSIGWNPPEVPRYLRVQFDETVYQTRFLTVPVGLDTVANDNEIRELADLSYEPAGGWATYANIEDFDDLSTAEEQNLAEQTVWRWFRIADGPYTGVRAIPGYSHPETASATVDERFQVLPLFSRRAEEHVYGEVSQRANPRIWGEVWLDESKQKQAKGQAPNPGKNTALTNSLPFPFSVDTQNGVIAFSHEMRKIVSEENTDPGIILEIAHRVRNSDTWEPDAHYVDVEIHPAGTGTVSASVSDRRVVIGTYNSSHELTGYTDNTAELAAKATEVATSFTAELDAYESYVVTYNVMRPDIKPTGKIRQVTHIVSDTGHGAVTVGGQHMEWDTGARTYVEKRRIRIADAIRGSLERAVRKLRKEGPRDPVVVR